MIKKQAYKILATFILIITCLTHVFPCICYAANNSVEETDNFKEAIKDLNDILIAKQGEIEGKLNENGIDDETKKIAIQRYFTDAVAENGEVWKTRTKDSQKVLGFWDTVLKISESHFDIGSEEEAIFIGNVPTYVKDYIETNVFHGMAPATETEQAGSWDYVVDNIAGILLYPARLLLAIVPAGVVQMIEWGMVYIGSNEPMQLATLDAIIFNKVPVTDANIFKYDLGTQTKLTEGSGNVLYNIRVAVAEWYVTIRNFCIALSLLVLVYIGIRMAISSIADDKAKYKKMLKDWLVSFALIFVLHYIMVGILTANDMLVQVFETAKEKQETDIDTELGIYVKIEDLIDGREQEPDSLENKLLAKSFDSDRLTQGLLATLLYFMLNVMTLMYIIVYIKRMISISILAMIAPIITITYPIDKAGDGKAQALNKWFKEFSFNVLIQPFHCVIYLVFVQNIYYVIMQSGGIQFGKAIIAIMLFGFMYKAEDIVKSIFGFETTSLGSAALVGAAAIDRATKTANRASKLRKTRKYKRCRN